MSAAAPASSPSCDLCGLDLPSHPVEGPSGARYCCHGCAHVASILEAVGRETETGRRALQVAREQGLLSTSAPAASPHVSVPDETREELRLRVEGLACPSCAWLVESVLRGQPGVADAHVDFLSDTARVVVDLRRTSQDALSRAVSEAGYGLAALAAPGGGEERREFFRLALAAAVSMNQMMLAFVGYDASLTGRHDPVTAFIGWVQVALAIPVVTWGALPIYRRGLAAFRRGRVVMETLLSLGILASAILSVGALLAGVSDVYLESATTLVALALGGRALERHFKRRAARSLTGLLQFAPLKARRAEDGRFVSLASFTPGQSVVVEPGETVPLDLRCGSEVVVREGLLTGEPRPTAKQPGQIVLAGSQVESGRLIGTVERPAGATVADSIRGRVEEALQRADEGSRSADRLAQGFVPLVLIVALGALAGHLLHGAGLIKAALASVSVLVVACPCAFGVAASLALSLAVLRLAKLGVLVKDPASLELLRSVDQAVFDKTGTLTRGDLSLVSVDWTDREDLSLLAAVKSLEEHSRHPIGLALARLLACESASVRACECEDVIEVPGMGITGRVGTRRIAAGKLDLFAPGPELPGGDTCTRIWFGEAGENAAGHIDLADSLRPEAPDVVRALAARGLDAELLSGDAPEPTVAVARQAGIAQATGGLLPEAKADRVRALRERGRRVAFVGDGFNDAEALAAADVGVALASGADLAMISAPIVVTRGDLSALVDLVDMARRAARVMRANFAWAFLYNVSLLPVAALGYLQPLHAAALMAVSSLSVALNSLRVRPRSDARTIALSDARTLARGTV